MYSFFQTKNSFTMKIHFLTTILFIVGVLTPSQAQEWVRQHPFEKIEELYDVDMAGNGRGLAVGARGTVLKTDNFGNDWIEATTFNPNISLDKVAFFPDGQGTTAIAIGFGQIYKTVNSGTSWQERSAGFDIGGYRYLAVPANNIIFIAGQNGVIKSTDGGQNWAEVTPAATDVQWVSISFVDASTGWLGGKNGEVFRTTNGGTTWNLISTGVLDDQVHLSFLNTSLGYAGVFRKLFKTTDGGETWSLLLPNAFGSHIHDLNIISPNNLVVSQGLRTYYSEDGGVSVNLVSPTPYTVNNFGLATLPDGRVWLASSYHTVAFSNNGGISYTDQIPGNKNTLQFLSFTDQQTGWAGGTGGAMLKTTNGGDTWTDLSLDDPAFEELYDGHTFSADEVWACGRNFIVRTTDGGDSWETLSDADTRFTSLFATPNRVYATDWNGKVHRTVDHGLNWDVLPVANSDLEKVFFLNDLKGFVVGWNGTMSKTTDGGNNWTPVSMPVTDRLVGVFFINDQVGWVCSDTYTDQILYTQNGGASWALKTVPTASYWRNIHFEDVQTGYLYGGSSGFGLVYRTLNGGNTWELLHNSNQAAIGFDVQVAGNSSRLWICGPGGNIESAEYLPTDTNEPFADHQMKIYPNPATGEITLEISDDLLGRATLHVFSMAGSPVLEQKATKIIRLDGMAPGLYLVQIRDGAKSYFSKLVVR